MSRDSHRRLPAPGTAYDEGCEYHAPKLERSARPALIVARRTTTTHGGTIKLRSIESYRGFSIVEALIAMGLVVLALIGLFGVMPYTYRTLQDDSLRVEASTAAQRYLDDVRLAAQTARPIPGPTEVPLSLGSSIATGQQNESTAIVDLSAQCAQPADATPSLVDCTVTVELTADGVRRTLAPLETYVTRQLP